jgi:tRNA A-37 threonylcarbamoyl transferase component Bud32
MVEIAERARTLAGRYRVQRALGEGALARTLLCTDLEEKREVAVKELRLEHMDSWKHVELFEREARVLKLIAHGGIPRVYDFFENQEDGRLSLCLVQECIDGPTLRERMDDGPLLDEDELIGIARGVLDILEHLHGRLPAVYHRDIKPSNIMLRADGTPVLIDFGGVCFGWREPERFGTTVVGTFGYMPPEQLLGHVGPRADLYALGATLLHAVTGVPPHEFSFESGRLEVPPDLPLRPAMRRLINTLLAPAPRDRPDSASAARSILDETEEQAPTTALARTDHAALPAVFGGDAPQIVDLGPPPRDVHGPFADVYGMLVDPLNAIEKASSIVGKVAAALGFGFLGVLSLGILPGWWALDRSGRRKRYQGLFRHGEQVTGTLLAVIRHGEGHYYATYKYAYEVGGRRHAGFIHYPDPLRRYFSAGDAVSVLYDPEDPRQSCFVFRPGGRKPRADRSG